MLVCGGGLDWPFLQFFIGAVHKLFHKHGVSHFSRFIALGQITAADSKLCNFDLSRVLSTIRYSKVPLCAGSPERAAKGAKWSCGCPGGKV